MCLVPPSRLHQIFICLAIFFHCSSSFNAHGVFHTHSTTRFTGPSLSFGDVLLQGRRHAQTGAASQNPLLRAEPLQSRVSGNHLPHPGFLPVLGVALGLISLAASKWGPKLSSSELTDFAHPRNLPDPPFPAIERGSPIKSGRPTGRTEPLSGAHGGAQVAGGTCSGFCRDQLRCGVLVLSRDPTPLCP